MTIQSPPTLRESFTSMVVAGQDRDPRPLLDPLAIVDAMSDAVIVVGLDYRVQQANKAARARALALGGQKPDAGAGGDEPVNPLTGRYCYDIFPCAEPCETPAHECPLPAVLATGETIRITRRQVTPGDRKTRYVDVSASPLRDAEGRIIAVIEAMRDVTAERELAETLVRRNEHLSVLDAVARSVNQTLDLTALLNHTLEEVLRLTAVDIGAIFLRDEALGNLELLAHRGLTEATARLVAQFGIMDGSCGGVIESQQLVIVPDVQRYRSQRARAIQVEQLSTLVHVPLVAHGCALGSMCIGTRQAREFDAHEQELLTAIGNQIAVAVENARLYAELHHKERMRGELLRKVITAQEEERKRIARELHDEISQNLTALIFAAEEATDVTQADEIARLLDNMRGVAQRTLDGVHKLIFDLRPALLDHLGLMPALRWLAKSRLEPAGMRVIIKETCPRGRGVTDGCRLPPETETALFRVVQEAVTNIVRHAMARTVRLTFNMRADRAVIRIEDDGVGFDALELTLTPDSGRGLGLIGMQERVELVGGSFDIDTAPGQGTRIQIEVPLLADQDRAAVRRAARQERRNGA